MQIDSRRKSKWSSSYISSTNSSRKGCWAAFGRRAAAYSTCRFVSRRRHSNKGSRGREKQKEELEKIAPAEERQRETKEKEEAEEYNIVAEEKQSLDEAEENIEAEEKEEKHNQLQLEVENGETNEDKLDGHEMIRGRYISVLSAIIY